MALSKGPLSRAEKIQKGTPVLQTSKCIAAIDFGTSSLSVAYTTPITRGDVKVVPLHSALERIPNSILIKKEQEGKQYRVVGIGNQAQSICNSIAKEEAKDFVYFERIKQLLKKDQVSYQLPLSIILSTLLIFISH